MVFSAEGRDAAPLATAAADADADALPLGADDEEEEEAPFAADEADLAEFVWNDTCSSAERNEGSDAAAEAAETCLDAAAAAEAAADDTSAAAAATTRRGHADAAPAVTPSSSSSIVIVGGTSGLTNPAARRGIAMPSPRKLPLSEEKAPPPPKLNDDDDETTDEDSVESFARAPNGEGASGVDDICDDDEEGDGIAEGGRATGRRMDAGRAKCGIFFSFVV